MVQPVTAFTEQVDSCILFQHFACKSVDIEASDRYFFKACRVYYISSISKDEQYYNFDE